MGKRNNGLGETEGYIQNMYMKQNYARSMYTVLATQYKLCIHRDTTGYRHVESMWIHKLSGRAHLHKYVRKSRVQECISKAMKQLVRLC